MEFEIISHGGIGMEGGPNLTGSCHELVAKYGDGVIRLLVDAGGFQGNVIPDRKTEDFLRQSSAVFLTHPHFDHIGDVPRAFFGGTLDAPIYSTRSTAQASLVSWIDSAKIAEQEYETRQRQANKKIEVIAAALFTVERYESRTDGEAQVPRSSSGNRMALSTDLPPSERYANALRILKENGVSKNESDWKSRFIPQKPPYDHEAAIAAFEHVRSHEIEDGWREIVPGKISFRFYDAGHIVGSASVLLRLEGENGQPTKHVLFSGDIGSYKWDFHPCGIPTPPPDIPLDVVVIEATYRDTVRTGFEKNRDDYHELLIERCKTHDRVFESCFSLDRFQNILYRTVRLKAEGKISCSIYADSPSGIEHIKNYVRSAKQRLKELSIPDSDAIRHAVGDEGYVEREREHLEQFIEYLDPANGYYQIISTEDDREFHKRDIFEKKVVITASGMANGGPVVSYLKSFVSDQKTAFFFPGYMAKGTIGRELLRMDGKRFEDDDEADKVIPENERFVQIEEANLLVRAAIECPRFLSGHADAEDILTFLESLRLAAGQKIVIVHGDNGAQQDLATFLQTYGYHPESFLIPELEEVLTFSGKKVIRRVSKAVKKIVENPKRKVNLSWSTQEKKNPERIGAEKIRSVQWRAPTTEKPTIIMEDAMMAQISQLRRSAAKNLERYENRLQEIFSVAGKSINTETVRILLGGLELARKERSEQAMLLKFQNEYAYVERALKRSASISRGSEEPTDMRKKRRNSRSGMTSAERKENEEVLVILRERISALEKSIIESWRLATEALRGLSDSHDVKTFVSTGQRPLLGGEKTNSRQERLERNRERLERKMAEALIKKKEIEREIGRIKEWIGSTETKQLDVQKELERVRKILSKLPEHLETKANTVRKRIMKIGQSSYGRRKGEKLLSEKEKKELIESLRMVLEDIEKTIPNRETLIATLKEFGVEYVEGKNGTYESYIKEATRLNGRVHGFLGQRKQLLLALDEQRGLRKKIEIMESEFRAQLENPETGMSTDSDVDKEKLLDEYAVLNGIRLAVDDTVRSLPEYVPIREAMDRIRYCVRDLASENPDTEKIESMMNTLKETSLERNEDQMEKLRIAISERLGYAVVA